MELNINRNLPIPKLACLYDREFMAGKEYFLIRGGRGGGKTEEVACKVLLTTFEDGAGWLCTREIQNSIEESVKATLEEWINTMELRQYFKVTKTSIINKFTGAKIIFKGMKSGTERDTIKSLKGFKYVWYEEAQGMTEESWEKLNPTIRMDGRKLFFTYNPMFENDHINTVRQYGGLVADIEVNYPDNPYAPETMIRQAETMKLLNPELYAHIWLGKPLANETAQTVLPYNQLQKCIGAAAKLSVRLGGQPYAGLDLAPGEKIHNDKNALIIQHGGEIQYAKQWRDSDLSRIARFAIDRGREFGVARLYFDAVGVGGFADGALKKERPPFKTEPFMGGSKVYAPESIFMRAGRAVITNGQYFKNAKAQQWWNLRLRLENTLNLLNGEKSARPQYILSFDPKLPDLDNLLLELAQATFAEDSSGRIFIDKMPASIVFLESGKKKRLRSPNLADAVGYSLLRSCYRGLKAN